MIGEQSWLEDLTMEKTKLEKLLDAARQRKMTAEEIEEQRVSFAYGNAPEESKSTMETMRLASTYLKKIEEEKK